MPAGRIRLIPAALPKPFEEELLERLGEAALCEQVFDDLDHQGTGLSSVVLHQADVGEYLRLESTLF